MEQVLIGDIWKDLDKRRNNRLITIREITDGKAICRSVNNGKYLNTKIDISRFKNGKYKLLERTKIEDNLSLKEAVSVYEPDRTNIDYSLPKFTFDPQNVIEPEIIRRKPEQALSLADKCRSVFDRYELNLSWSDDIDNATELKLGVINIRVSKIGYAQYYFKFKINNVIITTYNATDVSFEEKLLALIDDIYDISESLDEILNKGN